jgi:hypothetical protein
LAGCWRSLGHGLTVTNGKIVEIHSWLDPERLGRLDLTIAERD